MLLQEAHCGHYGVDWNVADVSNADTVEVPEVLPPTMLNGNVELHQQIDPLRDSGFHGIDIYTETLEYIYNRT